MIGRVRSTVDVPKTRILAMRVFFFLVAVLVADLLAAGVLGAWATKRSADHLGRAAKALARDDIEGFESSIVNAARAAFTGDLYMSHPGLVLARSVPGLGPDAEALRTLARTVMSGVEAGAVILDGFVRIDAEAGVADAIFRDGALDLPAIDELAGTIEDAREPLSAAANRLSDIDPPFLAPLRAALDSARDRLGTVRAQASRAGSFAALLPSFVGGEGDRTYLLAFQSPSEARGGGGLIGVYGLLSARAGRMELEEIGPIEDLGPRVRRPVGAPPAFARTYGPLSALNDFRQANLSPDFPTTADVLLRLYERVRGDRLDGVIAMDPIALGELTRGTGPLEAPGWNKAITPKSARRLLLFDIYRRYVHREREQNAYLRELVDELWSRIAMGDVDFSKLIAGFHESVQKQHVKLYSSDPTEQQLLGDLGASGDVAGEPGLVHMAFNNNNSGNKLDFFLRREQEVAVTVDEDGSVHADITMTLVNDVPRLGLRAIGRSGVASGLPLGENRMSLHFLLPLAADPVRMTIDGVDRQPFRGEDSGFATAWRVISIPPEEKVVVELSYSVAGAVESVDGQDELTVTLWPQAAVRPDLMSLVVTPPPGRRFTTASTGRITAAGTVEWSDRLRSPRTFELLISGREGGT